MNLQSEALQQGLTLEEFDRIVLILGREPNRVELGIFAVMWSEHCCYKSSKIHLRKLPTRGPQVFLGPGENAGVIDIGDDTLVAFKVESHNHPSFIEPYQGAATGVGGILRDIFTMGARPVAILDSLHFGDPNLERTKFLVHGVIGGIAGYGNCVGIPTVGGEVVFDPSYNGNNLVNAMAVGLLKRTDLHKGIAKGVGNKVIYLGSKTGRDGIHGATMASQEFGSGNEERRPTVQVGDPFTEKLLMEATLEITGEKLLVGIQDMGAAGLTCSTFEMSGRGKLGMTVDLDKVPLRETKMDPYEIFLSESQERMLLVAEPDKQERIEEIARKWEIDCVDIGEVSEQQRVVAKYANKVAIDLPILPITDEAPLYDRPATPISLPQTSLPGDVLPKLGLEEAFFSLIASPNLSSRAFVYRQYDQTVGTDSVVLPGSDAAVIRIKGTSKAIAVTLDSNSRYCAQDPYVGTTHVVAEAVRNLACVGAKALAATNCLNFGNPEDPIVMWQLRESIRGLGDACTFFQTPITGGNVSLYNQTGSQAIKPTPTIGMVGVLKNISEAITAFYKKPGDLVGVLGSVDQNTLYDSEFVRVILKRDDIKCPPIELQNEAVLQRVLLQYAQEGLVNSAHDSSDGGLMQTVAECSLTNPRSEIGFKYTGAQPTYPLLFWFGEFAGRAVVSFDESNLSRVEQIAKNHAIPFCVIGRTGGEHFSIGNEIDVPLSKLRESSESFFRGL